MAITTLGEAHDLGWQLSAWCRGGREDFTHSTRKCEARIAFDVPTLLWTRGRSYPLADLGRVLKCPRCGNRRVVVTFEPPPVALLRRPA